MVQNLGNISLGSSDGFSGRIRNLSISQNGPASVSLEWESTGLGETHVYHNGLLAQTPAGDTSGLTGLEEGSHNVNVVRYTGAAPNLYYDTDGSRIRLAWPQADSTVASYNVYLKHNGGDWDLTDTVTERVVKAILYGYPDSGTGEGRISVPSVTVEDPVNFTATVTILAEDQFSYSYTIDGEETEAEAPIAYKAVSYLPYGIQINWLDSEGYEPGDTYQIRVGILTEWQSETLPAGEYDCGVTALDAQGNESAMLELPGQIYIAQFSEPCATPTGVAYNQTTDTLSLAVPLPSGASQIRLYSNYNSITGELEQYVCETVPHTSWTGGALSLTLPEGVLRYYLRPVTSEGVELIDYTLHTTNLPLSLEEQGIILGAPEALTGTSKAGGDYELVWRYEYRENDSIEAFEIFRAIDGVTIDPETDTPIATVHENSGTGYPYARYEVLVTDTVTTADSPISVMVRAIGGGAAVVTDTIYIEVDSDAPTFGGELTGGVS